MYFDALTIAAVIDECRDPIRDGRIQQVVQVDELSLGIEIYAQHTRQYMFLSAQSSGSRVHMTGVKPRRGVETPVPLLLLLRKHVRGGRIVDLCQPPFERILHLDVVSQDGTFTLIVEAMGRHSNVILCAEDGVVMDAIKRVGPHLSRVRPILPGDIYVPPPPQKKIDPTDLSTLCLQEVLSEAGERRPLWRELVGGFRGVSPLMAKEIVYRATGSIETRVGEIEQVTSLHDAFQSLLFHLWEHTWEPCVVTQQERTIAFAPYSLTQYADRERVDSMQQALDRYYGTLTKASAYAPAKAQVRATLSEVRKRVAHRRQSLERQLIPQQELDRLRLCGEMILAYAHAIQPRQEMLEAQVDFDGPPMQIKLDPDLTAVRNAQAYFKRYEKAKAATAGLPNRIARVNWELEYLDQLATDLELASNWPEIDEVKSGLVEAGYVRKKRRARMQHGHPLRVVAEDGMVILVGRSARQNREVTFRQAGHQDLWLHVVDAPGAHVIVKSGGQAVSPETLQQAATLAAYYSALRNESGVLVAYTPRRYVRQIRNAGPGMVTYTHEETIRVSPAQGKEIAGP